MAGRTFLWVLGLAILVLSVSVRSSRDDDEDVEEVEEIDADCNQNCIKNCYKVKTCRSGVVKDSCGCCVCSQDEENKSAKIITGPEHTKNFTGGTVVLTCEVTGYPVPFVSWLKTNVNNNTYDLPGDDEAIISLVRGGPEPHEITSWIQIIKLRKIHEGDYTCLAFNKYGRDKSTARVKVHGKRIKRRREHYG